LAAVKYMVRSNQIPVFYNAPCRTNHGSMNLAALKRVNSKDTTNSISYGCDGLGELHFNSL